MIPLQHKIQAPNNNNNNDDDANRAILHQKTKHISNTTQSFNS